MIEFRSFLTESPASDSAVRLGLKYYGFGRYGRRNKVTHHSQFGRLVPVQAQYHAQKGEGALTHLEHVEDHIFNHGLAGARMAMDALHGVHGLLHGHDDRVKLTQKIDGAPSLVYGKDENGHFVATKSAFNSSPKINRTASDVDANHGHAPGLAAKLKETLKHIAKIHPNAGIKQGDLLYTQDDLKIRKINGEDHVIFKPNTITYAVPVKSDMGRRILRSKMGIATHTKYVDGGGRFPASSTDTETHPDVFQLDVSAPNAKVSDEVYSGIQAIGRQVANMPREHFDFISGSDTAPLLKQYINGRVRQGHITGGNADDFIHWLRAYRSKEINKMKSEKGKQVKQMKYDAEAAKMMHNSDAINAGFGLHERLAGVKHHIVNALDQSQELGHYLQGEDGELTPTNPEGYVVIGNTGSHKLVNRAEFSRANFTQPKTWGDKK